MYLSPTNISPASYIITVSTAGENPGNPTMNNTSQSVLYRWPFLGDDTFSGNITVASSSIPSGITVTVLAQDGTGFATRYGTGNVIITVGPTAQNLISNIWSTAANYFWGTAKIVTRPLVQNIKISDFSQLHPGTYPVTLTYIMQ